MLLSNKENAIYGKLYDITASNFDNRYGELQGNRSAFLTSVNMEVYRSDISVLEDVPTDDFLEASYVAVLRRFPDAPAAKIWMEKKPTMTERVYKEKILYSLVNSKERIKKGIVVYNNIFSVQKKQPMEAISASTQPAYPGIGKLYKFYNKLPKRLKRIAKKLLK